VKGETYQQSNWIILKAAELFFIQNKSQKEVAALLDISESTASRLIRRAREERIVEFVIRSPFMNCLELAQGLAARYNLKDAAVVPGFTGSCCDDSEESIKQMVALEGARYLQRIIKPRDILGVAWGGTIYHLVHYLNPCQKTDTSFVTLHGSLSCCDYDLDVRTLVSRIAMALGGTHHSILSEGLLRSAGVVASVRQEPSVARIFDLFERITISLSGIGSLYPEPTSPLARIQYLESAEFEDLKNRGVYGDIMLRFFDRSGREIDSEIKERTLAIDMDTYRRIPTKIIVASGEHKAHTIQAALKGGLVDVLIVDYRLAEAVMALN